MDITAALKECYLFEGLSEDELSSLARQCHLISRKSGEMLFHEGEPADYFYILLSGQVQAYKTSAEGKEMILHLFNPGDIFAEFPVFGGVQTYPADTLCLKDSRLLAVQGLGFKALAASRPDVLLKILMRLAERLRYFTSLVEDLSLRNVDARLAKYLLCVGQAEQAEIEIHKKTLAAILGTIPETLSRAFKKLSQAGVISVNGNSIRIRDRQALEDLADMPGDDAGAFR
jgi:CRP-like cAMP-binding protein